MVPQRTHCDPRAHRSANETVVLATKNVTTASYVAAGLGDGGHARRRIASGPLDSLAKPTRGDARWETNRMKLIRLRDDAILRRVLGRHHGRSRIALRTVLKCPRCKGLFRTTVDRRGRIALVCDVCRGITGSRRRSAS